ncbi:hypothetical protein L6164_022638 [Bauhinia variegata]|uniref:Uncharacterized protein n=1 Tax=Bauhinia variegata TaxID=167791 RepID=A0ACB9MFN0_BAUVA|nr:hypothetical protein L6164_022638 [Bauhinia variegata]
MAGISGRNSSRTKFQSVLEEEKKNKGLSLDPQRNHHHHHQQQQQQHHQHQNPAPNSRYVEEAREEDDGQISPSQKDHRFHQQDPSFHVQLQYLHPQLQNQPQQHQSSYGGLDTEINPLQPPKKRSFLPPPSSSSVEYARKMGETNRQAATSSRLGLRSGGGEIVEVQGGHIVRSTGRKDRHSKVCTAKGPRDRRVRLAAHTAIQFYDVQDRLGYDRPSKAVDWLIKKAKNAIDELAELPAWRPSTSVLNSNASQQNQQEQQNQQMNEENDNDSHGVHRATVDAVSPGNRRTDSLVGNTAASGGGRIESGIRNLQQQLGENPNNSASFIPPSLDNDIADIRSFFPMGATAETTSSPIQFQNYPPDLLSRTSSQNQDLRLSLQSFQDPILLHQAQQHQAQSHHHQNEQVLFSGTPLGFDGTSTGWSEQHHSEEHGRLHRMLAWSAGSDTGNTGGGGSGSGGFLFNSPSPTPSQMPPPLQPLFGGQSQYLSQRGPLQSSNTPSIRAWIDDPSITTATVTDHRHHYLPQAIHHQTSLSGIGFPTSGGFSGFRIPARIQGEEEHDGISDKPSSASSDSRH